MLATIQNYGERVRQGKRLEDKAFDALKVKLAGMQNKLDKPTEQEDKEAKIDGWVTNPKGKRFSVQIKVREGGDDIIFEAYKDVVTLIDGRDWITKADFYFFVDRSGNGFLYWTKDIHAAAAVLRAQADKDLMDNPRNSEWFGKGYEMKVTTDKANGNRKLMVFLDPRQFKVIAYFRGLVKTT